MNATNKCIEISVYVKFIKVPYFSLIFRLKKHFWVNILFITQSESI